MIWDSGQRSTSSKSGSGASAMTRVCPISGEMAEIVESNDEIIVEQVRLGRYILDSGAHSALSSDAETRRRMARWIAESHSLGIDLPRLTVEHVHFFRGERDHYLGGLQNADVGRPLPLAHFMLQNLLRSLDLAIRAAKGKSIREPDDIQESRQISQTLKCAAHDVGLGRSDAP